MFKVICKSVKYIALTPTGYLFSILLFFHAIFVCLFRVSLRAFFVLCLAKKQDLMFHCMLPLFFFMFSFCVRFDCWRRNARKTVPAPAYRNSSDSRSTLIAKNETLRDSKGARILCSLFARSIAKDRQKNVQMYEFLSNKNRSINDSPERERWLLAGTQKKHEKKIFLQ